MKKEKLIIFLDLWAAKCREAKLECDGTTRVLSYKLNTIGVDHTVKFGSIYNRQTGKRMDVHYWIELILEGDYYIVDYTADKWIGVTATVGTFKWCNEVNNVYNGIESRLVTNELLVKMLLNDFNDR